MASPIAQALQQKLLRVGLRPSPRATMEFKGRIPLQKGNPEAYKFVAERDQMLKGNPNHTYNSVYRRR